MAIDRRTFFKGLSGVVLGFNAICEAGTLTTVTKRNIIGVWFRHRFRRPDGTFFEVECTKEEYRNLARKNAGQPTHPNGKWVVSFEGAKFDSPDGTIGNLDYYEKGGSCIIRDSKGTYYFALKTDIIDGKVDFSKVK